MPDELDMKTFAEIIVMSYEKIVDDKHLDRNKKMQLKHLVKIM